VRRDGETVICADDVLALLEEGWDELVDVSPKATVFQTGAWFAAWIETIAEREHARPLALVHRVDGRLRGLLPLQLSTGGRPALRPLSYPWADYHEALGDPLDRGLVAALATALRAYVTVQQAPLALSDVVAGGLWERVARHAGAKCRAGEAVASIDLQDESALRHILDSREHRIKRRRMARLGSVDFRHFHRREDIRARFESFVAMHRAQWLNRSDAIAPFTDVSVERAYAAMVEHMAPGGTVVLSELTVGARPVAVYFGFRFRETYYGYRTAYDADLYRLSPGHLLLHQMIRDFRAAGLRRLDLTRGAHPYKARYSGGFEHNMSIELKP
jgi:CelD/BcsL family acetyltransferase involved in cellulose biosynthesis